LRAARAFTAIALLLLVASCSGDVTDWSAAWPDTQTDVANCGALGNGCRLAQATTVCSAGRCEVVACDDGWKDCNGDATDGCEADLDANAEHCGACGKPCHLANATAACSGGICRITSCDRGWGDCDGSDSNGCETNTRTDPAHCGTCGEAVPIFQYCGDGAPSPTCPPPFVVCHGTCVDTGSHVANCGFCDNACRLDRATAACVGGGCEVVACEAHWGDCDRDPANGCETDLDASVQHCCACGRVCQLPNATAACSGGTCRIASCDHGWGDCDGSDSNGCETDLAASAEHCGACGRVCQLSNATAACLGGTCRIASCDHGWGDCDGSDSNGCETNTRTSPVHCGACGDSVPASQYCVDGAPSPTCRLPRTVCDLACVDPRSDPANCGFCGNACRLDHATAACVGGGCEVVACEAEWGNCDRDPLSGCETWLGSDPNCGSCRNACSAAFRCARTAGSRGAGCVYWP
jgi:hypothetical protein